MPHRILHRAGLPFAVLLTAIVFASCSAAVASRPAPPAAVGSDATEALVRSHALLRDGRYDEARTTLEPAVERHPEWAEGRVGLALTFLKQERWETARKLFEQALTLKPQLHEALLPYGWCLYYLGELDAAGERVRAFLESEPDYPDAVFALALIEFDRDGLDESEKLLRRVIMLARADRDIPRQALAHGRLGDIFVRRGELSRARLELQRSLELGPDDARVRFKMFRVLQLLGDEEGAQAARRRYEELAGDATVPSKR